MAVTANQKELSFRRKSRDRDEVRQFDLIEIGDDGSPGKFDSFLKNLEPRPGG
jgi:hypothetical protein